MASLSCRRHATAICLEGYGISARSPFVFNRQGTPRVSAIASAGKGGCPSTSHAWFHAHVIVAIAGGRPAPVANGRSQSPPGDHDFRSMRTARQPSGDDDKTPQRVMDEFDARLSVVTRLAGGARRVVPDSVGRVVAPVRPRPAQPALQGKGNASSSPRGFSRGKSPRTKRALRAA